MKIEIDLVARTADIAELVKGCAEGRLRFDELCDELSRRGFKTTSAYEMVRAYELAKAFEEGIT